LGAFADFLEGVLAIVEDGRVSKCRFVRREKEREKTHSRRLGDGPLRVFRKLRTQNKKNSERAVARHMIGVIYTSNHIAIFFKFSEQPNQKPGNSEEIDIFDWRFQNGKIARCDSI
jgi:hypothetical protein